MTATSSTTTFGTFAIDRSHSEITFQVRHLLSNVRGRFSEFDGTIVFDEASPERSSVSFTIQTASIDTNEPARDAHLKSEDLFAVERVPTITFVSEKVSRRGDQRFDVTGDLSIRGVTKPVVLPVEYLGKATDPWGKEKLAFEAEITLNRKDFGLNWNAALEAGGFLVGDEVKVTLAMQAAEK